MEVDTSNCLHAVAVSGKIATELRMGQQQLLSELTKPGAELAKTAKSPKGRKNEISAKPNKCKLKAEQICNEANLGLK